MEQAAAKENNLSGKNKQAGSIDITYYTDPLCCWSWAFENERQKLHAAFDDAITWRYCMGGLLPSWSNYHDAINSVSKPLQMGPMWMHAAAVTNTFISHDIWVKDPPASSYPACIAVKSAGLQSRAAEEKYLFLLRQVCMMHGKNIAKAEVLLELADELTNDKKMHFDVTLFKKHLFGDEGKEAFKKDLQEVKYRGINRFPSLLIKHANKAKLLTGYHPFESINKILNDF